MEKEDDMKKALVLGLAGILASGLVAVAGPAGAAEYDRYESGTAAPPPPPRGAPPPPLLRPAGFHGGSYLFGNVGIFEPSDYYNYYYDYNTYYLSGYSSGLSGNVGFGSRVSPAAAIEGTVGYFSAEQGSDKASVIPVTIGGRLILPHPVFEPYIGAGIGVYFASLEEKPYSGPPAYSGTDDSNTTIGGYFSMGMDFWVNPRTALNIEGRYQMATPTFTTKDGNSFDLDMSGWELNFGFRINF
jgi:hypothetical protein